MPTDSKSTIGSAVRFDAAHSGMTASEGFFWWVVHSTKWAYFLDQAGVLSQACVAPGKMSIWFRYFPLVLPSGAENADGTARSDSVDQKGDRVEFELDEAGRCKWFR